MQTKEQEPPVMPNHVTTILSIEDAGGISLADIRAKFINDKGHVDFDVIAPSPDCLRDFEPHAGVLSRAKAALGLLPDPKSVSGGISDMTDRLELSNALRDVTTKIRSDDIPSVVRAIQNYAECGYMYWYDWNREHWGTKWNCYSQPDAGHPSDATSFEFETAWSHPGRMMREISKRLPSVTFGVRYADEDIGSNCGKYSLKSGDMVDEDIALDRSEQTTAERTKWTEFAFRTRHGDRDPASYGYDENWEYSDDVYEAYEKRAATSQG